MSIHILTFENYIMCGAYFLFSLTLWTYDKKPRHFERKSLLYILMQWVWYLPVVVFYAFMRWFYTQNILVWMYVLFGILITIFLIRKNKRLDTEDVVACQ